MTLKNRSRSSPTELLQALREMHLWYQFKHCTSNSCEDMVCTTFFARQTDDLENEGQGQGHHTQENSPGLVTMHMQYVLGTAVCLVAIGKNICGGRGGGGGR